MPTDRPFAEIAAVLRNLRIRRGLSQGDVAAAIGINNSYMSRIEAGDRRPSPKILKRLSEVFECSYDDLAGAAGIFSAEPARASGGATDPLTTAAVQQFINRMQAAGSDVLLPPASARRAVPVFDTVPAGLLKDANVVETHADVPKIVLTEEELAHDPRAFALVVRGDSMVEAGILDGDVLIVSPAMRVQPGDIAVVQIDRGTTAVKRVYVENDRVILQSANHHYKPLVLSYPDEVEILGKVILVRRSL